MFKSLLAVTCTLLALTPAAWAARVDVAPEGCVTQTVGSGTINWSNQMLRVTGSGAPPPKGSDAQKRLMAKRAAQTDAYRQLAEVVYGVRVDSETLVRDFVTESDTIKTQVSGLIKGARIVGAERYLSDGSVEVDVEMPVFGSSNSLADALDLETRVQTRQQQLFGYLVPRVQVASLYPFEALLASPMELAQRRTTPKAKATPKPKVTPKPAVKPPVKPAVKPTPAPVVGGAYTGLIVDASGLGLQPAMSPAVVGGGKQVYIGDFELDIDKLISEGILAYYRSPEAARASQRVGSNPLVVKAQGVSGNGYDLILSDEDVARVQELDAKDQFLTQLNVVAVM